MMVELLADKICDLTMAQTQYLALYVKERVQKTSGINPLKLNMDWPSIKQDGKFLLLLLRAPTQTACEY